MKRTNGKSEHWNRIDGGIPIITGHNLIEGNWIRSDNGGGNYIGAPPRLPPKRRGRGRSKTRSSGG